MPTLSITQQAAALKRRITSLDKRWRALLAETTKADIVRGLRACARCRYDLAIRSLDDGEIDAVFTQQPGKRTVESIWPEGWYRSTYGRLDISVSVSGEAATLNVQWDPAPAQPDTVGLIAATKAFMKDLGVKVTGLPLHDSRAEMVSEFAALDAQIAVVDAP